MSLKNRYEFLFYVQCRNGNPNGDPDMDNLPRTDPQYMTGLITDGAIKRRIRDYINIAYPNEPGMNIIMQTSTNINTSIARVREDAGLTADKQSKADVIKARKAACDTFFDVRTFGGVLSTGPNGGQVRGPVQIGFARSIDPVFPQSISITRVVKAKDVGKNVEKTLANYELVDKGLDENELRTFGRKTFIPYGLYEVRGFISANLSAETGFDERDLRALFEAILNMYEHDRSASKGEMSVISPLIIFKHVGTDSDGKQREREMRLGCAPSHKLFELVKITKKENVEFPRDYTDYEAKIDLDNVPNGVEVGFLHTPYAKVEWNIAPQGWLHK